MDVTKPAGYRGWTREAGLNTDKGCSGLAIILYSSSFVGVWGIIIIRNKNGRSLIILLVFLLFTIPGCFRDHVDTGSSNTASLPDYGRIVATDANTNNLMNSGYIVGYGNTTLFTPRNGDKGVYKIAEGNKTSKGIDEIQVHQLLVNDKDVFAIDHNDIYRFKPDSSKPQLVYQADRKRSWFFAIMNGFIIAP